MPSIKGTASVADARERSKALKSTRFPTNFTTKVKLDKVNKPVMAQWIEQKVTSILGFEDEIVSSTATNLFLPSDGSIPDPRRAQLDLVGFLGESESAAFASELWTLLVEAQASPSGIPQTILDAKKQELAQQRQQREARRPDIHRFVEEANRRAAAARNMVPPVESMPTPVSPTHPSDPPRRDDRGHASRYERKRKSSRSPDSGERKLPASRRMDRPPVPPSEDNYYRGSRRGDGGRSSHHSSRDRGRSMEYPPPPPPRYGGPTGGGEDEFRRTNDWRRSEQGLPPPPHPPPPPPPTHVRHSDDRGRRPVDSGFDRRRYHSDQEEMDDLERRLSMLRKRFVKRGDDYALDDEIEDIEDRLYELERRQRRRRRDEETRRRPSSRERRPPSSSSRPHSPPSSSLQPAQATQSRRSPERRHRGHSSSRRRSRSNSHSRSSDSPSSRSSASSRSSSRSGSRSRSSYDSRDRRRGRRSRSVSSRGSSSSQSSDDSRRSR